MIPPRQRTIGRPVSFEGVGLHTGEPSGYISKGGTGVPVRTFLKLIDDLA